MLTVYVLSLLYVDGYYVGFSENFPRRLSQHILGDGARITQEFGVAAVRYLEVADTPKDAKITEARMVGRLRGQGALAWGGGHLARRPKLADYATHYSKVIDASRPERRQVTFIEATPAEACVG